MRKSTAILSILVALLAVALATSTAWQFRGRPTALPTPEPTASEWPVHPFSHTGTTSEIVAVPRGAHSVTIDVACSDEAQTNVRYFGVAIKNGASRVGACNSGVQTMTFAIIDAKAGLNIEVDADDAARFTLTTHFSPDHWSPDRGTKLQCAAIGKVEAAVFNAESEYADHGITKAQWAVAIQNAAALAAGIQTEDTLLDPETDEMASTLRTGGLEPGQIYKNANGGTYSPLSDWNNAVALSNVVCADNLTPIKALGG